MAKQIIAVFFMVIWCCQLSSRYFVMLDFYLNRDAITEKLCINKDRPEMQCNGSCALKAKLQQEDRKSQETPERKAETKSETLFLAMDRFDEMIRPHEHAAAMHVLPRTIGAPVDRTYTIFHPPTAA